MANDTVGNQRYNRRKCATGEKDMLGLSFSEESDIEMDGGGSSVNVENK